MRAVVEVDLYGKCHTDFELRRIRRADFEGFSEPVTAYLTDAFISARAAVGVVFGHIRQDKYGRLGDGHLIRTSDVIKAEKEGRYWVLTTMNSRYVLATFQKGIGRASLHEYLRMSGGQHHPTPRRFQ